MIDIGGVRAGPGPEVESPTEETRALVGAAGDRGDRARASTSQLSVDTFQTPRSPRPPSNCGAVLGNDISGLADPQYLPVAERYGASVVATHIRLAPRVEDLDDSPVYPDDDVVGKRSRPSSATGSAARLRLAGLADDHVMIPTPASTSARPRRSPSSYSGRLGALRGHRSGGAARRRPTRAFSASSSTSGSTSGGRRRWRRSHSG